MRTKKSNLRGRFQTCWLALLVYLGVLLIQRLENSTHGGILQQSRKQQSFRLVMRSNNKFKLRKLESQQLKITDDSCTKSYRRVATLFRCVVVVDFLRVRVLVFGVVVHHF